MRAAATITLLALAGCLTQIDVQTRAADTARATPFSLPSHDGTTVALAGVLAEHHAVLVFYRGHW